MKNIKLKQQLRQTGASRQEARELANLGHGLQESLPHLDATVKRQIAHGIGFRQTPRYTRPRIAFAGAFAAFIVLVLVAQFAQPSSPLYALKLATQEVRVILQPSFKQELEQQRAEEQRQEVEREQEADDKRINEANDNSSNSSTSGELDDNSGSSGKTDDLKIESSGSGGSGSVEIEVLEVKIDSSGKSLNSGSSGSSSGKSVDELLE